MPGNGIQFSIEYGRRAHDAMPVPEFARLAEKLGYDGLTVAESNPFVVLAQAAAVTERLLFTTSVLVLPFHNPVMLAHETASLDFHSQGRLILGVGVGGERPDEFQAFGVPWGERGARANEAIEVLLGLWSNESFSYHGRFYDFDNHRVDPRPVQKPHPPLWIGGRVGGITRVPDGTTRYKSKTAALRRAARYGDGWFPYLTDPEGFRDSVVQVKAFARDYGRDLDTEPYAYAHNLFWSVGDDYEEALTVAAENNMFGGHRRDFSAKFDIVGTPDDCIRRVREYVDAGVQHFIVKPLAPNATYYIGQTERIAKEIVPNFK